MSEVIHDTQEFWRPPAADEPVLPAQSGSTVLVEACDDCGTEFMVGARFCYICGAPRVSQEHAGAGRSWISYLEFQNIREGFRSLRQHLELSTASLIAFLVGVVCLVAAFAVGFIYAVQNFADFQAIQYWRVEWLLGAVAAFLAGMMLKNAGHSRS
ncbi:MAG TPA: hypothetical protein VLV49_05110 [Terriglobales bacterium]|nr:hypothetical protein [Terriglobales bacterium]